jgi:hypothetical protein
MRHCLVMGDAAADGGTIDIAKVRIGLAIIGLVMLAALAGIVLVEAPAGKAVMFAIALTAFVRAFLLARSLRKDQQGSSRASSM